MNVVFIYKYSNIYGGIQEVIRKIGNALKPRENEVSVLTSNKLYKGRKSLLEGNLKIFYLSYRNLIKFLFKKKVDVVCMYEPYLENIFLAWLFKIVRQDTPLIMILCGSRSEIRSDFLKLFLSKVILKTFDNIVAVSNYTYHACIGKKSEKSVVIYNPVDTERYKPTTFKRYNLITIGRICKRKNYEDMIDVFEKIHQVDKKLILDIIGGLEKVDRLHFKYLKGIVKQKHLEKFINFHINISEKEKLMLLSKSTLYVTTSKHEMFGITTAEAIASGIPVIAYDNTATNEVCSLCEQILIKNGNKKDMCGAILKVLYNKQVIANLHKKGREKVRLFNSQKILESYKKLFIRSIIQKKLKHKMFLFRKYKPSKR